MRDIMESSEYFVDEALLQRVPKWRDYYAAKLGFRNHWYPVRLSSELGEGQVIAATLCGVELLLKRVDGVVFALRDRCIHRGVKFSDKVECYTRDTITCWYHGFTYRWGDGVLTDILASPSSKAIGKRKVDSYPVEEAKGLIFVYMGDQGATPQPLSEDVPPGFLDDDMVIHSARYDVGSNWRVGAENGFDGLHVYIHRTSPLLASTQRSLPIGHATESGKIFLQEEDGQPKGVLDPFEHHVSLWEGKIGGEVVVKGTKRMTGTNPNRTTGASMWLPGCLRVDNFPDEGLFIYEWYVPETADTHNYVITIGKRLTSEADKAAFEHEFWSRWKPISFEGFNNQDIEARVGLQKFYKDDVAWLDEGLIEGDAPLIAWRELCHRHNRGIQKPEDVR
ncbi:carbazole dioxygenase [Cupriavidus sp. UYMMa02A]|nr:carbazole dioxygenase [Cupriavidus sp. UYMMa02A]